MADYTVRPADLERDADAIVGVWTRNLRSRDERGHREKFDWYYRNNPAGAGRVWVLETSPGREIVGTAGLGLRRLRVAGKSMLAGVASDMAVDPPHRTLRPAIMLARATLGAVGNGVDFIYGLPNEQSASVFKRVGYNLDVALKRYVKVLRVERYLRSRIPLKPARLAVAGLADPALRLVSRETWRPARGRQVREITTFDSRFDDLWERGSAAVPTTVERTASFLDWRYSRCPLRQYTTLALTLKASERLLGYAVCFVGGDEQVSVVDVFSDGGEAGAETDMLAGVVRWARARGAASVLFELSGAPRLEEALVDLGFKPRGTGARIAVTTVDGKITSSDVTGWYFQLVDEDFN
jgi:hypothetical protein